MRDLERELRQLGTDLAVPATPDLVGDVRSSLIRPAPTTHGRRRLVLALAILAVALAGLAASPARTAVLRFFGIGAVRVELVDRLPAVEPGAPLAVGTEIDPAQAPFPILRSDVLGAPDRAYANGNVVTLLYGSPEHVRLLATELESDELAPALVKKVAAAGSSTGVTFVRIPGVPAAGLWIEGEPHVVLLPDAPARLARNTLVWTQDGRTLRLEGDIGVDDAVRVAESFH